MEVTGRECPSLDTAFGSEGGKVERVGGASGPAAGEGATVTDVEITAAVSSGSVNNRVGVVWVSVMSKRVHGGWGSVTIGLDTAASDRKLLLLISGAVKYMGWMEGMGGEFWGR